MVAGNTYLRTKYKTHYLHLITDVYSKKIVGYILSDYLMATFTLEGITIAVIYRKYTNSNIYLSDRSLQYCGKEYA